MESNDVFTVMLNVTHSERHNMYLTQIYCFFKDALNF
jgi:hypothetical protein